MNETIPDPAETEQITSGTGDREEASVMETSPREHVMPVLHEIEQLREQLRRELTLVANWLFAHWPDDLPAPYISPVADYGENVKIMVLCSTRAEWDRAVSVLTDGDHEVTVAVTGERDGETGWWRRATRKFGDRVSIEIAVAEAAP